MILLIIFVLLAVAGIYNYRNIRSKKQIAIPVNLHKLLFSNVLFYQKLTEEQRQIFQSKVITFLKETHIESVEFKLEDLDIILVAASAVIPVFYFENWHYSNLSTVIIYPDYFNKDLNYKGENRNIGGMVGTGGRFENQMILSRKALHHGFKNKTDKGNTGIHEFIHLIDKLDGDIDGIPKILLSNTYTIPWLNLIHKKIEEINNDQSDIRAYGGTNQEEFFAVAAEYFFERPKLLRRKHPELYIIMESFFCKKE